MFTSLLEILLMSFWNSQSWKLCGKNFLELFKCFHAEKNWKSFLMLETLLIFSGSLSTQQLKEPNFRLEAIKFIFRHFLCPTLCTHLCRKIHNLSDIHQNIYFFNLLRRILWLINKELVGHERICPSK